MAEAAETIHLDDLETAADAAIAACDGDARATVAALLAENAELAAQISRLSTRVSSGYARGRVVGR